MAYSVSPRRMRNSVGGKNSENRSTRIPTALATVKCPSSWRMISTMIPRIVRNQLTGPQSRRPDSKRPQVHAALWRGPRGLVERRHGARGDLPGQSIGVVERLERAHWLGGQLRERSLDDGGNLQE